VLLLCLGLTIFLLPHLFREFGLRDKIRNKFIGAHAYIGLFSALALLGLGLIVWGKSLAPFIMIWEPIFELRYLSSILMVPAFILVVSGSIPMSYMRWKLKNPMMLGVFIWGLAHLWANGDLASMLLFGIFTIWASIKFFSLRHNVEPELKPENRWIWRDLISIAAGMILYLTIYINHGQLFGVGLAIN